MKNKNSRITLFGIVGTLVALAFFMFLPSTGTGVVKLSGEDFLKKYKETESAILLDVRTEEEYSEGHIDNAHNINFQGPAFSEEIAKLDSSKTYFVYCRSGNRSGKAIAQMRSVGINTIYELEGGLASNKGVPLVLGSALNQEYVVDPSDMLQASALTGSVSKSEINEKEKNGLILMREEEKLARDVYTALGSVWGLNIFSNIASSEQTHMDAVKVLLTKYGITDPVIKDVPGVFASKDMQKLYDTLVTQGKQSRVQALVVGATIEDLDIRDLENLKKETTREDILSTYNALQKGSRNHMRAFTRNLKAEGVIYVPQYISQNTYDSIINSPQERGQR